jgi:DNA-binding transcriptional ArsR family regulator
MAYTMTIAALSDPTRRAIVENLRQGPMPVGRLACGLPVSRPAVSQHLKVLAKAGLVDAVSKGAERHYYLSPNGFEALRGYLDLLWGDALTCFAAAASDLAEKDRT